MHCPLASSLGTNIFSASLLLAQVLAQFEFCNQMADPEVIDWLIDVRLYSAILRSLEQTHCARMLFYMSDWLSIARFLNIHRSGVLTELAWLVPHETAAVSAQVLCTPYNHVPCHIMQSHIRKVYGCLAVTCHLHFWQNDQGLLRATAVTRGWNGYWNKSQHRKSTLEKKISPAAPAGIRTRDLSVTSPAL